MLFIDSKKHNEYIDSLKGIAIFLMIWGHCIEYFMRNTGLVAYEDTVLKTIYSFHMPLFMLISGYLFFFSFSKRDFNTLISHRSKPLLFSIVFCGLFNYYITVGVEGVFTGNFGVLLAGEWLRSLFDLWFLWSVLLSSVIVAFICKKVKNVPVQIILLLVSTALFALFPGANLHIFVYPYFIIGFYYAKYRDYIPEKLSVLKYISIPVFPVMIHFFQVKHYIYTSGIIGGEYPITEYIFINLFRWATGLVGSVFALTVVGLVFKLFKNVSQKNVIYRSIINLGKNSLQMYCLSFAFVSYSSKYLLQLFVNIVGENILINNMAIYNFVVTPLAAIIYCFIVYFAIKLFDKIKLGKILFGR